MGGRRDGKAMAELKQLRFTADEFIAWAMEQPTGRYELSNGRIVGMAPECVSQTDRRAIVHHRHGEAGEIASRILREGTLALDPPGIELSVADVFASL